MTQESSAADPLLRVVRLLQHPVPIAPGLERRTRARQRYRRRVQAVCSAGGGARGGVGDGRLAPRTWNRGDFRADGRPSVRSVALVGDFDDWRADQVQLERNATGEWQATVKLRPGRYRFAYLVNHEQWRADTHAPSAPDDFGRPTSVLTVTGN